MLAPNDEFDSYVIVRKLGEGGMGEVYEALQDSPRRKVALKVLRRDLMHVPELQRRFEREVDAMAAVEHPNVVPIYDRGDYKGSCYFTMRLIDGPTLHEVMATRPVDVEDVLGIIAGAAAGLDACHAHGVVHRDVKPLNILVDRAEHSGLLSDFGVARADSMSELTRPGFRIGTAGFMAPEALRGDRATRQSDIYSLACIAYLLLTGVMPRAVPNDPDAPVVPPSHRKAELGARVERALLTGLARAPGDRPRSAREFVAELREAVRADAAERSSAHTEATAAAASRAALTATAPYSYTTAERVTATPTRRARLIPAAPRRHDDQAATVAGRDRAIPVRLYVTALAVFVLTLLLIVLLRTVIH